MPLTSKEIIIVLVGGIISIVFTLFSNRLLKLKLNSFDSVYIILVTSFIIIIIIILIMQLRINEVADELEIQKREQRKLNETLKIYERLSILESEVLKNGKKK